MIAEYREKFLNWTKETAKLSPEKKIAAFFQIFMQFSAENKICPVATLGLELHTLPTSMASEIRELLRLETIWLEQTIIDGQNAQVFLNQEKPQVIVRKLITLVLGAQILARIEGTSGPIIEAKKMSLQILTAPEIFSSATRCLTS